MKKQAVLLLLLAGCAPGASEGGFSMPLFGKLKRALDAVDTLSAQAQLVPKGGAPLAPLALTKGDDGVSFSGFLEAEPGDYTLEIRFEGAPANSSETVFLGRYVSDAFTVAEGAQVTPTFSMPLDTIGRPEDGGDLDNDGLGAIDEILWGADLNAADTDQDGVPDGQDCDPVNEQRTFTIVSGGSLEDCDGDGERRADLPYEPLRGAGSDCNDRDPAINPAATDDCSDPVDQDCNPATCPVDDREAPTITMVAPASPGMAGCHTEIEATVQDNGQISSVTLDVSGIAQGPLDTLQMEDMGGGRYRASPLNLASGVDGLLAGAHTVTIEAVDFEGNRGRAELDYTFVYDVPTATRMMPQSVGAQAASFELSLEAFAPSGIARVSLYSAPRNAMGLFSMNNAQMIGEATTSPARFMIDPGALSPGDYLLYPVVEDQAGNRLQPDSIVVPSPDPVTGTLTVSADHRCAPQAMAPKLPVRVLTVNEEGMNSTPKMRDLLPVAIQEAAAVDPAAQLVSVLGYGLRPDGTIGLDDASSFTKRWTFGFRNPGTDQPLSVSWFTPAWPSENPVVDPMGSGVGSSEPLLNPTGLPDSDQVAAARAADVNCSSVMGDDDDFILYQVISGMNTVTVISADSETWRAPSDSLQQVEIPCS